MKKLVAIALLLALACLLLPVQAEEGWTDFHCEEMQFTVKVPTAGLPRYEEEHGCRIYLKSEGSIPYVQVYRRPPEGKFKNPDNYLNNILREYLEETYGDDSLGMNFASVMEIGGRELLSARYQFKIGDTVVTQISVLDIRDGGDVEFTAKFYDGNEEITLQTLEAAVASYAED